MPARELFDQLTAARETVRQKDTGLQNATVANTNAQAAAQLPANAGNADVQTAAKDFRIAMLQARVDLEDAKQAVRDLELQLDALDEPGVRSWLDSIGRSIIAGIQACNWLLIGVAFLIASIMYSVTSGNANLRELLDGDGHTRGLLTFLFGISTIGIAFMLVYQAFMPGVTVDSFRFAREIFGSLIAVLGTIVGFYFGTATTEKNEHPKDPAAEVEENKAGTPPGGANPDPKTTRGTTTTTTTTPKSATTTPAPPADSTTKPAIPPPTPSPPLVPATN